MKKAFAIVLAILLIFTACSKGGGDTTTDRKKPDAKSFTSSMHEHKPSQLHSFYGGGREELVGCIFC